MRPLRFIFDQVGKLFEEGKPLARLYPLYEAADTFFYSPKDKAPEPCHIRDAMDYKRMMSAVIIALMPCVLMAMYNTGYQANLAMQSMGASAIEGWRGWVIGITGIGYNPSSIIGCILHGALYFLPIYIVTMVVGIFWEVLFAIVRKHEVNEGFFVTGMLFPLTLPATIPLWQVAVGISFGVVIGKEIFGGTGRNFLNPALTARAFLFFAYASDISGNSVWVAVDGYSGATPLGAATEGGMTAVTESVTWMQSFLGTIQGSMGETSALACLIGAGMLLLFGIASWRIMLSMLLGALALATLCFVIGSDTNPMFSVPPHWHLVMGGFAFGLVYDFGRPIYLRSANRRNGNPCSCVQSRISRRNDVGDSVRQRLCPAHRLLCSKGEY